MVTRRSWSVVVAVLAVGMWSRAALAQQTDAGAPPGEGTSAPTGGANPAGTSSGAEPSGGDGTAGSGGGGVATTPTGRSSSGASTGATAAPTGGNASAGGSTATTATTATTTTAGGAGASASGVTAPTHANAGSSGNGASHEHERRPDDDGRFIDWVFIQVEGGGTYVNLTGISSSGSPLLPSLTDFKGTGPSGGLTVGARYSVVALAAHANIARIDGIQTASSVIGPPSTMRSGFDLGELSAEVQLRIPVPIIEPYARLGFGYAWMGGFQLNEMWRESVSNVNGWTARFGMGLDVWLGRYFTLGAGVDATVMNLRRGGVTRMGSACPAMDPACVELTQDGDAVGFTVNFHAQVGVHF